MANALWKIENSSDPKSLDSTITGSKASLSETNPILSYDGFCLDIRNGWVVWTHCHMVGDRPFYRREKQLRSFQLELLLSAHRSPVHSTSYILLQLPIRLLQLHQQR